MPQRRIRGIPFGLLHPAAGSAAAAGRSGPLRRPPSPGIGAYRTTVQVPIGNDGIAFPVVFGSGGTAQAFAGPSGIGTSWDPSQASIWTSIGQLDAALCSLYVGPLPLAQYLVVPTLSGGGAQFALGGYQLVPGWFVWALWTGGTPGETGYLSVTGSKQALVQ